MSSVIVFPQAFGLKDLADMSTKIKAGRLEQANEDPDILNTYVKCWDMFPELRGARNSMMSLWGIRCVS